MARSDETIVVLDDETINKIAAGEVVERPASVVKELVENSIDAGASAVTVEVAGVPGDFIRVSDDGSGMSRRDARTAFLRHATSKIRGPADLQGILTLGFRGEALASIAAVARVELVTRREEDAAGTRIVYEGGTLLFEEDAPSPVGTAVTCRDLFFNTPARRKFQRRPATELDHIHDVVARLALAWPKVRFRLIQGGREVLLVQGGHAVDRRAAVAAVYGASLARTLLPVVAGTPTTRIEGLISPPNVTKANRDAQCVFVNGRPVSASAVVRVIENSYGRRLPSGRYPAVFLWISTDPRSVDVNVHPAKREAKFSVGHEVYQLAAKAAASALRSAAAVPDLGRSLELREAERRATAGTTRDDGGQYRLSPAPVAGHEAATDGARQTAFGGEHPKPLDAWTAPAQQGIQGAPLWIGSRPRSSSRGGRDSDSAVLVPLGMFMGAYVLATDGSDLVIVDQHAAHERVLYEAVLRGLSGEKPEVQTVIPTTLELAPRFASRVADALEELAKAGFVLEPFGPSSFLLRAVPSVLGASRRTSDVALILKEALEACLDDEPAGGGMRDGASWRARLAAEIACRAAVKAHSALEPPEVERLLADLAQAGDPYSCPHGRPTLVRISRAELDRAFRRA
ncbi:MAG: DNA mismatch repair endonuclease MutL [Firmicutes bacterium]|jgi:DNA mismatch repair protein MutL|nr:DNA mismatch repair endonuclease MutL [Bacillota bacterium]MDH7495097.1 DNA mismatch repair endonuclease MutL [Bacillota bacterium]